MNESRDKPATGPGPDSSEDRGSGRVEHEVHVAADPERAWEAWADPALIAGWFVTGPVLVDAGPERLRAWDEIEGTLELKAVPGASGSCTIGLRAVSWSLPQEEMDRLERRLAAAVEALAKRVEQAS